MTQTCVIRPRWVDNLMIYVVTIVHISKNAEETIPSMKRLIEMNLPNQVNDILSSTLHRIISARISRWMTYGPPELPILPGGKCCALALLNIIPMFAKENTSYCQIYHQNPACLCVPHVWLLRDTKRFFENFVNNKMAYVTNCHQKDERWQRLLLGDWLPSFVKI